MRAAVSEVSDRLPVEIVHLKPPVYHPGVQYVIVARDPIQRAISAFNWRYRRVVIEEHPDQRHKIRGEYEILKKYGSITTIAEALFDQQGRPRRKVHTEMRRIRHVRWDIAYYLGAFLRKCPPQQIAAVLMQETLDADIERVFGVRPTSRLNDNSALRRQTVLSRRAWWNLRRYLHEDYAALLQLYDWGKIPQDLMLGMIRVPDFATD